MDDSGLAEVYTKSKETNKETKHPWLDTPKPKFKDAARHRPLYSKHSKTGSVFSLNTPPEECTQNQ